MKKALFIAGFLGIGYSFYYYFKKQLSLAFDLDYKLKSFRLVELTAKKAEIKTQIEARNKSNFNLKIDAYNLVFSYKGIPVAETISNIPITVNADSKFTLDAEGTIDLEKVTSNIMPFITDVLKKQPIKLQLSGFIKINFFNFSHKIQLENEEVVYSNNLLSDIGLEQDYDKAMNKLSEILGNVGIKI